MSPIDLATACWMAPCFVFTDTRCPAVAENDAGRVTSKCDVTVIGKSRDVSACDIGDLSSQHNTPDITVLIDLSRPYV